MAASHRIEDRIAFRGEPSKGEAMFDYGPSDRCRLLGIPEPIQLQDRLDTSVAPEIPAVGEMRNVLEALSPYRRLLKQARVEMEELPQ
jgi:hypothetical protein